MINKLALILTAALILLIAAACQAQVEPGPAQQSLETAIPTAVPTKTVAIETIVTATILEPVTPSPVSQAVEELIMPVEPTGQSPTPSEEDSVDQSPSEETAVPDMQPAVLSWVEQSEEDLAQRLSISTEQIELLSFESQVWPNAGMGCPQPGMMYAQVMVEGYLIRLKVGDEIYNYHGGGNRAPFLCEQPGPKIVITKQAPFDIKQTPTKSVPPPRD